MLAPLVILVRRVIQGLGVRPQILVQQGIRGTLGQLETQGLLGQEARPQTRVQQDIPVLLECLGPPVLWGLLQTLGQLVILGPVGQLETRDQQGLLAQLVQLGQLPR